MRRLRRGGTSCTWHLAKGRGHAGQAIFYDDVDRKQFLVLLEAAFAVHGAACHAYCLMQDHVRLMVCARLGQVRDAVQCLNEGYVLWFDQRHGQFGARSDSRISSQILTLPSGIAEAAARLHRLPVDAGLCREPHHWPWSSAEAYRGGPAPAWLETRWLMDPCEPEPTRGMKIIPGDLRRDRTGPTHRAQGVPPVRVEP